MHHKTTVPAVGTLPGEESAILPKPLVIIGTGDDDLLSREWLITNSLGSYASASLTGANTRRYHGLLVAALNPPVARVVMLSNVTEQFVVEQDGREHSYDLTSIEFDGKLAPSSLDHMVEFRSGLVPTFVYRCGGSLLVKQVLLAEGANVAAVRYRLLEGPAGRIHLRPFFAIRDFHGIRCAQQPHQFTYSEQQGLVRVEDRQANLPAVYVSLAADTGAGATLRSPLFPQAQWWYGFRYRQDLARGQDGLEDLYSPGWFECPLREGQDVQLTASVSDPKELNFASTLAQRRTRLEKVVGHVGLRADVFTRRLAVAADAFVTGRRRPNQQPGATLVAGYHWFADWGRDTMVSLPGLLLETGRYEEALATLLTWSEAVQNGMIPNRFDDYGGAPHHNSIDASLWYVLAVDRYLSVSGDSSAWRVLGGAVESVLRSYHDGTMFDIHADADGLLTGGTDQTQLTWMDVKFAGEPVTPRQGKAVEINALWLAALRIGARRTSDNAFGRHLADLAGRVAKAFGPMFWNASAGCLYDYVQGERKDASIRPNQIFAVALPDCPLPLAQQRAVVEVVRRELLTPYGLRTLSPHDSRYRGRYGQSWESRDRSYHQGTVWPWLMGPFIEAYLRVSDFVPDACRQARAWLEGLEDHLQYAGVGSISEILHGDEPHYAVGCIAQAWSVAETLRALRMIQRGKP